MPIDVKQTRCFLAAIEEGSIRAASERLALEPSSVSRQIKSLEESLSVDLIERSRSGITPTEAGIILVDYLKRQKSDFEAVLSEFDALRGMRRGELVIAVGDGFVSDLVGNALASYRKAFPGFKYTVQSGSTDQVLHAVRTDQAHLGFAFNAPPDRSLRMIAQTKQPLQLLVSPHSEWHEWKAPLSIHDLVKLPCALLTSGFGVGAMVREVEAIYGVHFQAIVEANSLAILKSFVREGLGGTILPAFVVTRELTDGTIITKSLSVPELRKGEAALFTRAGRRLPEGAIRLAHHAVRGMSAFSQI